MDEQPQFDSDRRVRMLRNIGVATVAALMLGSCGGMLLGHYTVTGMAPFAEAPEPAYLAGIPDEPARGEWIDARAEAREALAGLE